MQYRSLFDIEVAPTEAEPPADVLPSFEEPSRPDWDMIDLIHREHNFYVTVTRKRTAAEQAEFIKAGRRGSPAWEDVCAIPVRRLPGVFEQMTDLLEADSYQTLNGMLHCKPYKNKRGYLDVDGSPLPAPIRTNDNVCILTSCWVDLDFHSLELTVGQVIGAVIDAETEGRIPRPSLLINSGRGCWVVWFLRGRNHALHERKTFTSLPLWEATMGKIMHTFKGLGADYKARDPARVCRIAGSINTKANRRVSYFPWLDEFGNVRTYELEDLARQFGIDPVAVPPTVHVHKAPRLPPPPTVRVLPPQREVAAPPPPPTVARSKNPKKQRAGIAGHRARWNNERARFYTLLRIRYRIVSPHRNAAVSVLAHVLKKLGRTFDQAVQEVIDDLFPRLDQTGEKYTLHEAGMTVVTTFAAVGNGSPSHVQIADRLGITPDESVLVGWPAAGSVPPAEQDSLKGRAANQAARLERLAGILAANNGEVPSVTQLVRALRSANFKCGRATVHRDLVQLGVSKPEPPPTKPLF